MEELFLHNGFFFKFFVLLFVLFFFSVCLHFGSKTKILFFIPVVVNRQTRSALSSYLIQVKIYKENGRKLYARMQAFIPVNSTFNYKSLVAQW